MMEGGCLCGKVRYEYDAKITEVAMCHCSQCRKAQGGAFATNSPIDTGKFRIISGTEQIKEYQSNEEKVRAFCTNCGSPLYSALKTLPNIKRLRLGTLDTSFTCSTKYHIYTASKAAWDDITDAHPQHKEMPE